MTDLLADVMPTYDFAERHRREIDAPAERTWAALTALTLDDLTITRPLLALRNLGRPRAPRRPLLTEGPVTVLHREEGRLAVGGAVAQPWRPKAPHRDVADLAQFAAFAEPGWTKYLTQFRIDPDASGRRCTLSTETRGASTDAHARRRFRLYWTIIRLPSGLVRRDVLRAVARSASR